MISIIIILTTFLSSLVERFSKKQISERKWILKNINFDYVTACLLLLLLIFQIIDKINESEKEARKEIQSTETYKTVFKTNAKMNAANYLLDSVIKNINSEIQFSKNEFIYIDSLNSSIKIVRKNVEKNINEYTKLNLQYEEQLKVEKQKIISDKPDLRVIDLVSVIDSNSFGYQFKFSNYGKRIADSVKYYAVMVFIDSLNLFSRVDLVRTNINEYNVLSIPGGNEYGQVFNSGRINKEVIRRYKYAYFLVKYTYKDILENNISKPEPLIFRCSNFEKNITQFAYNIDTLNVDKIKKYLYFKNKECYDMLFE